MDDLSKARNKKFAAEVASANWEMNDHDIDRAHSTLTIYSCNAITGPRLMGRVTQESLRDALSGDLLPPDIRGFDQGNLLAAAIKQYDDLPSAKVGREHRQMLLAAALAYAVSTRTWSSLSAAMQSGREGCQFLIFDWNTRNNVRVMRPAVVSGDSALSADDLSGYCNQVVAMHLAKNPDEVPVP